MTGNCVPQAKPGLLGLLVCKNERTLPGLVRQETAYRACRYRDVNGLRKGRGGSREFRRHCEAGSRGTILTAPCKSAMAAAAIPAVANGLSCIER